MTDRLILTLGILGGTGKEGQGLAYRWARAGYHIIIGSRTPNKADRVAAELNQKLGQESVRGLANEDAASQCDIAVLTVPYAAHVPTLEGLKDALAGKVLIDVTVPMAEGQPAVVEVPEAGSAAQEAQNILGESVKVVAAFQNISFVHLREDGPIECDVLVTGDSDEAKDQALQLVQAAGLRGWNAGGLKNSVVVEGMTSLLIAINKKYGIRGAGIRITGDPKKE